jgi:hypothetical protein
MRPPLSKLDRKDTTRVVLVKSNEPQMIYKSSLVQEELGPGIDIVVIIKMNTKITNKFSKAKRVITPFLFGNNLKETDTVINNFSGGRTYLIINRSDLNRFGLGQNIRVKRKGFERMFKNPMKTIRKIGKSKVTCRFNIRTLRFYGKQILGKRKKNIARRLFERCTSKPGFLGNISKMVKRSDQSAGIRSNRVLRP